MAFDEDLARRVRLRLEGVPPVEEKKMFGGIGFLLSGNMACGVHGENLIVRLDPAESDAALALPHVRAFDMTGRPMKGWIFVTPEGTRLDHDLAAWIDKGLEFARRLPPK